MCLFPSLLCERLSRVKVLKGVLRHQCQGDGVCVIRLPWQETEARTQVGTERPITGAAGQVRSGGAVTLVEDLRATKYKKRA